jgi:hypothetical protein
LIDSRSSRSRKEKLRRTMLAVPIAHLAQIGALAAREQHELGKTFRFKPTAGSFVAFRSAAPFSSLLHTIKVDIPGKTQQSTFSIP